MNLDPNPIPLSPELKHLEGYRLILASQSPRRLELLRGLNIPFSQAVVPSFDESFPSSMPHDEVPEFLSRRKAEIYLSEGLLADNEILLTADTVVITSKALLGKPANRAEAAAMLAELSNATHRVLTGICLSTNKQVRSFTCSSTVHFAKLSDAEIDYYLDFYQPFDKAGAYGIQEWVGYVGISRVEGSFYNVMGLPVHLLYQELCRFRPE